MSFLRFIGLIITLAVFLTGCSQKISKIEYDKKNYEYAQLQMQYELLKQEVDSGVKTVSRTSGDSTSALAEYKKLEVKYEQLLNKNMALQAALNNSKANTNDKTKVTTTSGTIPVATYNELKIEKANIEKRYTILENRYNALKKSSLEQKSLRIANNEIIEPMEIDPDQNIGKGFPESEENSADLSPMIVHSVSSDGLFFDFDTYEKTDDFLVLEIAIKNNSQGDLKTFWDAKEIVITDKNDNPYTAKSFRIGVDYPHSNKGTLLKKVKDDNTVFARFAFEELPQDLKEIKTLQFVVIINGKSKLIKFTQINISSIEKINTSR